MNSEAERLRKLAEKLRAEAAVDRQVKTAQVMCAASSLELLKQRLGVK